jgi:ABC-2 type transport system ATP-binding protein
VDAIEVRGLTKMYGRARGVIDLSLAVPEGQIFGFIGPNGAGKSTTIRALLGFLRPTRGEAFLFGAPVFSPGGFALRAEVGYVPGEVSYYDDMRVGELLEYSAAFYPADSAARRKELAARFDLDLARRVDGLSLGNKKKVALVQALQHRPRLLILDEPTSGLDPLVQEQLFLALEEENRAGRTIFFSSHVLSEVQRLCHRVGIIREGRLVDVEDVTALRARQVKRVRARLAAAGDPFAALDGVSGAEWSKDRRAVSFLYRGPVAPLFRALAEAAPEDAQVEEPSLEEIFLGYYHAKGGAEESAVGGGKPAKAV